MSDDTIYSDFDSNHYFTYISLLFFSFSAGTVSYRLRIRSPYIFPQYSAVLSTPSEVCTLYHISCMYVTDLWT